VLNFCTVELSAFYLDVLKDRLYASAAGAKERRSAQTAMHRIAETLARLLAPILVHTTDEVWSYLKLPNKPESVHLADLPKPRSSDETLLARWTPLLEARDDVKKAIEEARQSGKIGNPLEARVTLSASYRTLEGFTGQLPMLFLVSQVAFGDGDSIEVEPAEGVKCARCWLVKMDVGASSEHPDLCARCAAAIGQLSELQIPLVIARSR